MLISQYIKQTVDLIYAEFSFMVQAVQHLDCYVSAVKIFADFHAFVDLGLVHRSVICHCYYSFLDALCIMGL